MTEELEYIEHSGRIKKVDYEKKAVTVVLLEEADCGECPAGKLCTNFTPDKNVVVIPVNDPSAYKEGEFVYVRGSERLHRKAIMIAMVVPSVALIAVMIGLYLLTGSQLAACLGGLGAMILFFIALYLIRNKLAHEFVFEIVKEKQ